MSLKIRFPLLITLLVVLSLFITSLAFLIQEEGALKEEIRKRGTILANDLANVDKVAFMNQDPRILTPLVTKIAENEGVEYAALLDRQRRVIVHSKPEHFNRYWFPFYDRFTFSEKITILGEEVGYSEIRISPKIVSTSIQDSTKKVIPVSLVIIFISVSFGIGLAVFLVVPIHTLTKGAERLSQGKLDSRIEVRSKDELGKLATTFNGMAGELQQAYNELKDRLVEIQKLFKQATEDGLTHAYVHRYFKHLFEIELKRGRRIQTPLSLIMCDIDHFKHYNDTYGHKVGDQALQKVASILLNHTREHIDIVGRYGGEEFVIVLPGTTWQAAKATAERLRRLIATTPIELPEGKDTFITLSFGVTTTIDCRVDKEELIEIADRALYQSKASGRNCVHYQSLKS